MFLVKDGDGLELLPACGDIDRSRITIDADGINGYGVLSFDRDTPKPKTDLVELRRGEQTLIYAVVDSSTKRLYRFDNPIPPSVVGDVVCDDAHDFLGLLVASIPPVLFFFLTDSHAL